MEEDSELGIFFRPPQTRKKTSLWGVGDVDLGCLSEATRPQTVFFVLYLLIYFPYCLVYEQEVFRDEGETAQHALQYAQLGTAFTGLLLLVVAIIVEHEFFYLPASSKIIPYCTMGCGATFVCSFILLATVESVLCGLNKDGQDWIQHGSFALNMLMFVPLALLLGAPTLKSYCIWLSLATCFAAKVVLAGVMESAPEIVAAVAQCIICASVVCELRRERSDVSKGVRGDMMVIANQQIQEHDMNVKHMVANVAHDLKTPVSSFMAGVEGISQALSELSQSTEKMYESGIDYFSKVKEYTEVIGNYVSAMRNTNSFMLMTINRCIDYTKASKGLKLVPKYETIDLMETLSLPLNCMKDIQQRVVIRMEPLPRSLCSKIITDKQWLQENVLCLLSNAVKYSSEGYVAVSVRLEGGSALGVPVRRSFVAAESPASHRSRGSPTAAGSRKSTRIAPHPGAFLDLNLEEVEEGAELSSVQESTQASELRFEIEDTGIGMSEEAMASLFSPFRQNQSLAGGTGLGLFSLAKRIEALHGKCGVQRRRDGKQGSLFWFTIPYRPDHIVSTLAGSPNGESADSFSLQGITVADHSMSFASLLTSNGVSKESSKTLLDGYRGSIPHAMTALGRNLNILIVDDSAVIVRMTSLMLKRCGYSVTSADNGAEALKLIMDEYEQRRVGRAERRPRFNSAVSEDMADILHVGHATSSDDEPGGKFIVREGLTAHLDAHSPLFDVILMDLQMPIMDGLEATRRLREWEQQQLQSSQQTSNSLVPESFYQLRSTDSSPAPISCPAVSSATIAIGKEKQDESDAFFSLDDVPFVSESHDSAVNLQAKFHHFVLGVSANCEEDTMEEAKLAGFDAFISKPFSLDTFHQILRTHKKYLPLK